MQYKKEITCSITSQVLKMLKSALMILNKHIIIIYFHYLRFKKKHNKMLYIRKELFIIIKTLFTCVNNDKSKCSHRNVNNTFF